MNEIIESLYNRKSVRVYEEKAIPNEMKNVILEAAMQAPTAGDRKSTRLNSSHIEESRMPSSA